ncbi:MAG: helix-turn-helix domain-containing protein [Oceanospirillaceae bacterium]|nr:helix-turn-helix domain-containing protein [Oceanospirillaceae bacterium]
MRIERAQRQLEQVTAPLSGIARDCGFGSADRMRRAFLRHLGVNPSQYRQRFASPNIHSKGLSA